MASSENYETEMCLVMLNPSKCQIDFETLKTLPTLKIPRTDSCILMYIYVDCLALNTLYSPSTRLIQKL
jgi:hypothetical protein